jgi:hypothetical protein
MVKFLLVSLAVVLGLATAQEDNFKCPDAFEGFYPHLYSCDKYWHCQTGSAKLKTCGNGLVFDDLDPTYTAENCDYMHNVDCGNRTEIEPPISAPNCPRDPFYKTPFWPKTFWINFSILQKISDKFPPIDNI